MVLSSPEDLPAGKHAKIGGRARAKKATHTHDIDPKALNVHASMMCTTHCVDGSLEAYKKARQKHIE